MLMPIFARFDLINASCASDWVPTTPIAVMLLHAATSHLPSPFVSYLVASFMAFIADVNPAGSSAPALLGVA